MDRLSLIPEIIQDTLTCKSPEELRRLSKVLGLLSTFTWAAARHADTKDKHYEDVVQFHYDLLMQEQHNVRTNRQAS